MRIAESSLPLKLETDHFTSGLTRRKLIRTVLAAAGGIAASQFVPRGFAQDIVRGGAAGAEDVSVETVHFPSDDIQVEAYLSKPKTPGKHPAVLVVHENRGLNDNIRSIARRFAAAGYVALAPDLLSRVGGTAKKTPEEAGEAIASLLAPYPISDLKSAFEYLLKDADVDVQKISTVGFDWGGWRSFTLTLGEPKLYRVVMFYGSVPDGAFGMVHAPVLAHYARWDNRLTGNAMWIDEQMKKAGKKFVYYVYEADHGFFNETSPRYNADAAKLAWSRTLDFLAN
jgi:carboxymethylenebutenolidase